MSCKTRDASTQISQSLPSVRITPALSGAGRTSGGGHHMLMGNLIDNEANEEPEMTHFMPGKTWRCAFYQVNCAFGFDFKRIFIN